ncbi:MAG TPA: sporulation protein YhbH [Symbiobacteriaceae bacterium]|nr:sporulation protein YhbH [Symbiobacteriaceae bacterium]
MASSRYSISREDWSLHRQGQMDQERHLEKVREAIKKNLADIISDESIITSDGKRMVKVPIRSLNEYRFRYNWDKQERAGQGQGDSQEGQVIAKDGSANQKAAGKGKGAGDQDGEDYYETMMSVDDLGVLLFEDLGLPHLDPKKQPDLTAKKYAWEDVRKSGLQSNIDKKRTIMEAMKRNLLSGKDPLAGFSRNDLRYKTWEVKYQPQTSAVVLAMMDTSGSMGDFEKYIARGFFFWMTRFLRTKYDNVIIHFLAHSTEAREVTEEEFFTKGESGGTRCSSVYELALKLIAEKYPPDLYNIYPFHFSDGDNLSSDNPRSVELVTKLLDICALMGYGEIDATAGGPAYYRSSTLYALFNRELTHPRFASVVIKDKTEVFKALRTFFGPDQVPAMGKGVR